MSNPYKNYSRLKQARIIALERFNWNCALCGKETKCIHHLDGTKSNHKIDNLLPVCQKCHLGFFHSADNKIFSFWIWDDFLEKLRTISEKKRIPVSQIINSALADYLKKGIS